MSINSSVDSLISNLMDDSLVSGLTLTQSGTYTKRTPGAYTPLTGAQANTDATAAAVKVIQKEYSAMEVRDSGGAVLLTDKRFLLRPISGVDIRELEDDKFTVSSRDYRIVSASEQIMGSTKLIWEVQCR